jgi:hypothetical protein
MLSARCRVKCSNNRVFSTKSEIVAFDTDVSALSGKTLSVTRSHRGLPPVILALSAFSCRSQAARLSRYFLDLAHNYLI